VIRAQVSVSCCATSLSSGVQFFIALRCLTQLCVAIGPICLLAHSGWKPCPIFFKRNQPLNCSSLIFECRSFAVWKDFVKRIERILRGSKRCQKILRLSVFRRVFTALKQRHRQNLTLQVRAERFNSFSRFVGSDSNTVTAVTR
jgi:hypothetical protein